MRVLVFGGNGFIGGHLIDLLCDSGYEVHIFSRNDETFRSPRKDINYIYGDFSDKKKRQTALKGIDIVYQLISTTLPKTSNDDMSHDIRTNLLNMIDFLDDCVDANIKKLIYLSSGGTVYGLTENHVISETHQTFPISSYGIVKLAVEKYLYLYKRLYDLDYTVLRVSNPYGERQDPRRKQGVVAVFLYRAMARLPLTVLGDGEVIRDYIYVGDVARACLLAAQSKLKSEIFNVSSEQGLSLNELLDCIKSVTGNEIVIERKTVRSFDVPKVVLSNRLARKQLDWSPEVDFETGLSKTFLWLKEIMHTL